MIDVLPEDVVWENLKMSSTMRTAKTVLSWALTIFLIIIWFVIFPLCLCSKAHEASVLMLVRAIPVALCGFIGNINTLTTTVKFLSFLKKLPSVVIGIIQGILPTGP